MVKIVFLIKVYSYHSLYLGYYSSYSDIIINSVLSSQK